MGNPSGRRGVRLTTTLLARTRTRQRVPGHECPEAGNVEDTCSPVESEQPPTSSRIHTASPDGPVLKRAGRKGYETAARIAEAMARTPQPTQVDVARELGISDRTVRRHLDKIKLDQSN